VISALSLLGLAFASASDGESSGEISSEQEWTRRFEEVDQLRKKYQIPALSAQERMALLLGRPNYPGYAIKGTAYHQDDYGNYEIEIRVYRPRFFQYKDLEPLWVWKKCHTSAGDASLWKSTESYMAEWVSERIDRIVQELAKRMYVYSSTLSITEEEYLSHREIEAVLGPHPKVLP
jgi:hypothetical protein